MDLQSNLKSSYLDTLRYFGTSVASAQVILKLDRSDRLRRSTYEENKTLL